MIIYNIRFIFYKIAIGLKIIIFVRKKASLTRKEFIKLWEAHSQKVIKYKEVLLIKDYTKTFPYLSYE